MASLSSSYRNGYTDALKLVLELVEELEHDAFIHETCMAAVLNRINRLRREVKAGVADEP